MTAPTIDCDDPGDQQRDDIGTAIDDVDNAGNGDADPDNGQRQADDVQQERRSSLLRKQPLATVTEDRDTRVQQRVGVRPVNPMRTVRFDVAHRWSALDENALRNAGSESGRAKTTTLSPA